MEQIIFITLIFTLIGIVYQDFKHRAVWWLLFPLAFFLQLTIGIRTNPIALLGISSLLNLLTCGIQISVLYLYFIIIKKAKPSLINNYLGLGDVLFFIVVALAFSTINFVLFEIATLLLALIISLFLKNKKQVPLAGIMSGVYVLILIISEFIPSFNPYIDIINLYL